MNIHKHLNAVFSEIMREAKANPAFCERLGSALGIATSNPDAVLPSRSNRRTPAVIDPFEEYKRGESALRERLSNLHIEQLKDVVAQFGMDNSKLAMKWKDKDRVIELIVSTVTSRSQKGNAFRAVTPTGPASGGTGGEDQRLVD